MPPRLRFAHDPGYRGAHHLAFRIPMGAFADARAWRRERAWVPEGVQVAPDVPVVVDAGLDREVALGPGKRLV